MRFAGTDLCGVAVVVGNYSAEPLFPFDFAFGSRRETGAKNLVPNIQTLMRAMVVVVRKPLAINVVQLVFAEAEKIIEAFPLNLSNCSTRKTHSPWESTRVFLLFSSPKIPKIHQNSPRIWYRDHGSGGLPRLRYHPATWKHCEPVEEPIFHRDET